MNILKGKLNKKNMAKFAGVKIKDVDRSLDLFREKGYISYEKIRGKYHFILFGEPIKEIELNNETG
ncbi:hypothetical protein ES705_21732 [subsurface metagenome]|jgi:transcription initiation factor IIE alpha subunit